jgi:O-antigen/teichoic acid export membrane protein
VTDGTRQPDSLFAKARTALGWSLASTVLGRFGTLAITVAVARILGPGAFGTYAVAMVALLAVLSFNELGVSLAVVRWPGEPEEIAPTVATLSVVSSALIYLGCFTGAPLFARLMGEPEATPVVRLLTLSVVISGLVATPVALLQRQFRQRAKMIADQVTTWLGAVVSISCAVAGAGAMSLAVGQLVGSVAGAAIFVALEPAGVRLGFDRSRAAALLRFGLPLAGSSIVVFLVGNVDRLIVGALLGPVPLGVYVLAANLSSWPMAVFSTPVRAVAPAMLAQLQGDPAGMRRTFLSTAGLLAAVTFPVCALLGGAAGPIIGLVYGPAWSASAAILPWLAAVAALRILFELCYDFFVVLTRTRVVLTAQLLWLVALVPTMLLGVDRWGVSGAAAVQVAVAALLLLPVYLLALHRTEVPVAAVAARLGLPLAGSAAVAALAWCCGRLLHPGYLALLPAGTVTGLAVGVLLLGLRPVVRELRGMGEGTSAVADPGPAFAGATS